MSDREQILEKVYRLAYKYEAERGSCPQCVLAAIKETLGIGDPETIKASQGLAGGSALSTEGTCGALVGGLLAISSIIGRNYKEFSAGARKIRVYKYSKKLYDKFVEKYGSINCKDVHKKIFGRTFNFFDDKDYAEFEKQGGHVDKCPSVSGDVARWTAEIILDDIKKYK